MTIDLPMAESLGMPTEHSVYMPAGLVTETESESLDLSDSMEPVDDVPDVSDAETADEVVEEHLEPPKSIEAAE